MTTYNNATNHILTKYLTISHPSSILDVGMRLGTISMITANFLNTLHSMFNCENINPIKIDGVQVSNKRAGNLNSIYTRFFENDVLEPFLSSDQYDCIIISDFLEYLEEKTANEFLNLAVSKTKKSLILNICLNSDDNDKKIKSKLTLNDLSEIASPYPFYTYNLEEAVVLYIDIENYGKDTMLSNPLFSSPDVSVGLREKYKLRKKSIEEMNLSSLLKHVNDEYQKAYFMDNNFKEHYKLLAYFSTLFNDSNIFDIGTNLGNSALALSYNSSNRVISYDIENLLDINNKESLKNIEFCIGDVLNDKRLLKAPLILIDTYHDGVFEKIFIDFLKKENYRGLLIMDDIHLPPPMIEAWKSISEPKEIITDLGHWSGTGIVDFCYHS